jgi:hypothetical protein
MDPSDEEKKALIIRAIRLTMAGLCSQTGTQDPLIFVHRNADGTGCMTAIWESEAAALKTLLLTLDGPVPLTYDQQKRVVLDDQANSWPCQGVNYTIIEEGVSPRTAKALLTFPTYRQLLDIMYEVCKPVEQQQTPQAAVQQNSANVGLRMMQMHGAAPTHYQNGIPHYGGFDF